MIIALFSYIKVKSNCFFFCCCYKWGYTTTTNNNNNNNNNNSLEFKSKIIINSIELYKAYTLYIFTLNLFI